MPVYNLPDLTKRALDSIPFDEDLEVIVVNDASSENMDFIKDYPVKYISYEENKGCGHARNTALDLCQGEYIFGMDNDDFLYTDEFRKAMKELDGTDMVFINVMVNSGTVLYITPETKIHYCAFWSKFFKRELMGDTRCREAMMLDDYYFNLDIMNKPHTEKYTDIVAYHYNFPREGSIIWKRDHPDD